MFMLSMYVVAYQIMLYSDLSVTVYPTLFLKFPLKSGIFAENAELIDGVMTVHYLPAKTYLPVTFGNINIFVTFTKLFL